MSFSHPLSWVLVCVVYYPAPVSAYLSTTLKVMTRDGIVTLSQIYIYACKVRKMLCKTKTRLQSGAKHKLVTKNVMYPREMSP